MVVDDFIKNIEKVYGEYENPNLRVVVKKYLSEDIDPNQLSTLYRTVLYGHKAIFKAPCIATIEECIDKARMKKGKFEPYRIKQTKVREHNYRKEAEGHPEEYTDTIDLKGMLNKTIKKVER